MWETRKQLNLTPRQLSEGLLKPAKTAPNQAHCCSAYIISSNANHNLCKKRSTTTNNYTYIKVTPIHMLQVKCVDNILN